MGLWPSYVQSKIILPSQRPASTTRNRTHAAITYPWYKLFPFGANSSFSLWNPNSLTCPDSSIWGFGVINSIFLITKTPKNTENLRQWASLALSAQRLRGAYTLYFRLRVYMPEFLYPFFKILNLSIVLLIFGTGDIVVGV